MEGGSFWRFGHSSDKAEVREKCNEYGAISFACSNLNFLNHCRFGVRGIPALVVLDAMSGHVVVPKEETRRDVMQACQRGDDGIEEMLDSWIARIPQESQEILAMLELTCEDNDGEDASDSGKEHHYFTKREESTEPAQDPAVLIKESFAKFVAEGLEPNVAAAKAIQMVAEQKKSNTTASLDPGPLNDVAWKSIDQTISSSSEATSCVATLNESNNAALQTVLSTALKYVENVKREPWTPKFRSFKLSNKIVDRATRIEGALDLLCSLGIYIYSTETDFMACIPLSTDLHQMETSMKALLSEFSHD